MTSRKVSWLHLSDFHAGAPDSWDAADISSALVKDLKSLAAKEGLAPDLLYFTGDLTWSSKPRQYRAFADFLLKVRNAFDSPIPAARTFIVPGNHDVERAKVADSERSHLQSITDARAIDDTLNAAGPQWNRYMVRLGAYRRFLANSDYKRLAANPSHLWYAIPLELPGLTMTVAGFNSAWSAYGGVSDKGKIWIGAAWQLSKMRPAMSGTDITIGLVHHPSSWVAAAEKRWEEKLTIFDFFLYGHEHDEWVDDGEMTRIAAGPCYGEQEKSGYNIVTLNLDTQLGEVWLRKWDAKGQGWIPNVIANRTDDRGVWALKHNRILVGPRRSGRGCPVASTTGIYQGSAPIGRDEELGEASEALLDSPILLLHGAPGQGKTALARFIALSLKPRFTDGVFEVPLQNERQIDNALKQLAVQLGDAESGNPMRLLEARRCLVILDGFEELLRASDRSDVRDFLQRLTAAVSRSGSRIIITSQDTFDIGGLRPLVVKPLHAEDAAFLFRREARGLYDGADQERLSQFAGSDLGGHPLSIKIVARFGHFRRLPMESSPKPGGSDGTSSPSSKARWTTDRSGPPLNSATVH